jgi:hypothetical protein
VCSQHDDTRGGGPRGVHARWFRDDKSGEGAEEHHEREPGPVRRGLEYGVLAPAGQVCREESRTTRYSVAMTASHGSAIRPANWANVRPLLAKASCWSGSTQVTAARPSWQGAHRHTRVVGGVLQPGQPR